jgi:hypothetical protein
MLRRAVPLESVENRTAARGLRLLIQETAAAQRRADEADGCRSLKEGWIPISTSLPPFIVDRRRKEGVS